VRTLDLSRATISSPLVVGSILLGADEMVAAMVKSRIPHMKDQEWGPCTAFGVVQSDKLVGGVVYHCFRKFDICFGAAFDTHTWAKPATLRALFDYPFNQLGCVRVTAITGRKNKPARKMLEHVGFKLEGVARRALDGINDGYVYGLLKEDCRWIEV
jgi:RimJ/RimL family protein N-acetyltransferase